MPKDEIVLSKMFSGDYLLDNLGHEVINLYQSDNGKNYVYLNDDGMFDKLHFERIKTVLFVKTIGNCKFQVIGKAEGLIDIYDPSRTINEERLAQIEYLTTNDVTYGGTLLHAIFVGNKYQYVYVTFKAETMVMVNDGVEIILSWKDGNHNQTAGNKRTITISQKGQMRNGGKEYFDPTTTPTDYAALNTLINDKSLWGKNVPKHRLPDAETAMRVQFARRIKKNNHLNNLFK